ncbi:Lipid transfer-like protein VAS [Camellia lanceoleosa]|uniref:Lipid transfer-like protein VAS n=1 Tax=Camellia lanceoleosa TaxID=1840588 RepID=A0ACC0G451_9ERIC|nr:Lipid transfer-like protein VAS [Camellia lanceoleosa]
MGCSKISFSAAAMVVVVLMATTTTRVADGQQTATCISKLTPCASYLNATSPPASCCNPLREAVTQDLQCLCNLYTTPDLLKNLGINVTDALALAGRCKIPGDLSSCAASAPSSPSPPATPGSDSNRVSIASAGMLSILLFWASMMLY